MTARPAYRVERARPADVRQDLERLWGANLQVDGGVAAKYEWLYRDAPFAAEAVFVLRAGDGPPVGTAGVGVRTFQLDGDVRTLHTAGLLADLAVDKAHRSVGPALAMVREVKAYATGAHALAYGFPNQLAQGVFKRAGYQALGTITRYARPLRHAGYADRIEERDLARVPEALRGRLLAAAKVPALARLGGAAFDAVQLARGAPAAASAAARLRLDHDDEAPDGHFDDLWARARGEYRVVAARSARFLAWRFPPAAGRSWLRAVDRRTGKLRAYATIELQDGTAHLRDLFGHHDDVIALLDRLPIALYRAGATSASIRYLGAPWLANAIMARGFAARQSDRMIAVATGAGLPAGAASSVLDPEAWHLTDADEDV